MALLLVGPGNYSEHFSSDLLLETDLGQPTIGIPGTVSLFKENQPILQFFIGYSSAKHNTSKYLESVHKCYHKYLSEHGLLSLIIHCHNWKSGTGKVIISDIIKITQPIKIIEFFDKSPSIESVLSEKFSFLEGNFNKPRCKFESLKITEEKNSDFKAFRSKLLMNYFGVTSEGPISLISTCPKVCFIGDVKVKLNDEVISESLFRVMVGKIAGLLDEEGNCLGVGMIRDFNQENGMIYIISPVKDLQVVVELELYSGEGAIVLEKGDIFNDRVLNYSELDVPYVLPFAILTEQCSKYHPSRNLGNNK
jgi:polynucleotide 5'-kinase involved in rRNA processing